MTTFALRLKPGQDIKAELLAFANANVFQAAVMLTCVGSVKQAALRMAGRDVVRHWAEKMEIVSLVGTLAAEGLHLHMALADSNGHVWGGHLVEGNLIYTTAEIVIGELDDLRFMRSVDVETGYKELEIQQRPKGE